MPSDTSDHAATPRRRRPARRRLWLFRLVAALGAPLLLFALLELALRVIGYGFPTATAIAYEPLHGTGATGPAEPAAGERAWLVNNDRFAWRFFPPTIAREPDPYHFAADKPADVCRIFILGESAAQGFPDPSFSFSRILERMLEHRYPGVRFEVINTAMPAINSHVIREIADDCAGYQPDVFVIYMGNNEVVGPYGAGTVFGSARDLTLVRLSVEAKALRVGQLFTDLTQRAAPAPSWRGMEMFLQHQVSRADPRLARVHAQFELNLEAILDSVQNAGAPVLLCTVASNLADSAPFASVHRESLGAAELQAWQKHVDAGAAHELQRRVMQALDAYQHALAIDDAYAELHFRIARCLAERKDASSARWHFVQALELDALRFRADDGINEAIRSVAAQRAGTGVMLVDVVAAFDEASAAGLAGRDVFLEHVHPNFHGNYVLARTVLGALQAALPEWVQHAGAANAGTIDAVLSESACADRLAFTLWDRYRIERELLQKLIVRPPFTNQLDHAEQHARLSHSVAQLETQLRTGGMDASVAVYEQAMAAHPEDWHLPANLGLLLIEAGELDAAVAAFAKVTKLMPHEATALASLGKAKLQSGDATGALNDLTTAVEHRPRDADLHLHVGLAQYELGQYEQAEGSYATASAIDPSRTQAWVNRAAAQAQQGRVEEALATCREGLATAREPLPLYHTLARILASQNRKAEANAVLQEALQHTPDDAGTKQLLDEMQP